MTTLQMARTGESSPDNFAVVEAVEMNEERPLRRIADAVIYFTQRAFSFMPLEAPDYMSEHFGHSKKHPHTD